MKLSVPWTRAKRQVRATPNRRQSAAPSKVQKFQKANLDQLLALVGSRTPIEGLERVLSYPVYTHSPRSERAPFRYPDGQDAFLSLIQAFLVERPGCASLFLSLYGYETFSDGKTTVSSQMKFSYLEKSWSKDTLNMNRSDMWHLKNAMNTELAKFSLEYAKAKNIAYLKNGVGSAELIETFIWLIEKAKK